jgi:uncharacterized protein (DUF1697 family)
MRAAPPPRLHNGAMTRYVALLRGVSPMNARMPQLQRCFEAAGFGNVRTLLSSGNVVFDADAASAAALERRCEQAMERTLDRSFATIVRPAEYLQELVASDPFDGFRLPDDAKRIVTFLRQPAASKPKLPVEHGGATILDATEGEVFSAYVAGDEGPVFMSLLERTFGKGITTRTLDTVRKCAWA